MIIVASANTLPNYDTSPVCGCNNHSFLTKYCKNVKIDDFTRQNSPIACCAMIKLSEQRYLSFFVDIEEKKESVIWWIGREMRSIFGSDVLLMCVFMLCWRNELIHTLSSTSHIL